MTRTTDFSGNLSTQNGRSRAITLLVQVASALPSSLCLRSASIYLTGHDGKKGVGKARTYVAEGTRAGMILGIDTSGKPEDDIAMRLKRTKLQL